MNTPVRYRLQRKVPVALPNILGNHSFPVHTYQWKDIAVSNDLESLKDYAHGMKDCRIEDCFKTDDSRFITI